MLSRVLVIALAAALAAGCGGGGGGGDGGGGDVVTAGTGGSTGGNTGGNTGGTTGGSTGGNIGGGSGGTVVPAALVKPQSDGEAVRFLGQASFGAAPAGIGSLRAGDYAAWFEAQFAAPRHLHKAFLDAEIARLAAGATLGDGQVTWSFWKGAAASPDALRQRVVWALSQIFVISLQDGNVAGFRRGVGGYLDMLGDNAFGSYRTLLEQVTLHPMMGLYLSHLRNQKESGTRVPDQNYAREVMQLFSIGLYELNADGTPKTDASGRPIETYDQDDIVGLSRVFTGFSWAGPDKSTTRFNGGGTQDPNRDVLPMQSYPQFHSQLEKSFLGTTIPAQATPDPEGSLRIALDRIAAHPNVGTFIGRQLIQRLVTSNPSTAYIARVSAAFDGGRFTLGGWSVGTGVRGDLKATVVAVLMDPEARGVSPPPVPAAVGKVREPIARMLAWMRAFNARSTSEGERWQLGTLDSPATQLGQSPMRSPSVFNFYRPGYVPPNTAIATAGLVSPEFQILHESSVVGYANFMRTAVSSGLGALVPITPGTTTPTRADIQPDYTAELALADNPAALVDRVNLLLTGNSMSDATRADILQAVQAIALTGTAAQIDAAKLNRVRTAVFLGLVAPEFVVQR